MTSTFTVRILHGLHMSSHVMICCENAPFSVMQKLIPFIPSYLRASQWLRWLKKSVCNAGDPGSIPGSGRSSGEGNGNPLQYSWLENPMNREAWRAIVHGVAKSWDMTEQLTLSLFLPSSALLICIDHSFIFWHRKEDANNFALALGQNHL